MAYNKYVNDVRIDGEVYGIKDLDHRSDNTVHVTSANNAKLDKIDDYVVDCKTSKTDQWSYRKWASGLYECWKQDTAYAQIDVPIGNIYGNEIDGGIVFPITFKELPIVNVTMLSTSTIGTWASVNRLTKDEMCIQLFRGTKISSYTTYRFAIYVVGRWK